MKLTGNGKMSRATRAILARLPSHNVEVQLPQYERNSERSVNLVFKRLGGTSYHVISLTRLTPAELELFRETIQIACDLALPTVQELDKKAKEDLANGDPNVDDRVYRSLPVVVVNADLIREYDSGLLDRHPNVFAGSTSHFFGLVAPSVGSSGVASSEHEEGERINDSSPSSESKDAGQVAGDDDS